MSIAEFFSSEYNSWLLALLSAIVVYLGWRTTYVREERLHPTAVLIIDSHRRRFIDVHASAQQPIARSASSQSNHSNSTEEADIEVDSSDSAGENIETPPTPSIQSIIDEVNDLTITGETSPGFSAASNQLEDQIDEIIGDFGQRNIIQVMDGPDSAEGLRRRRLAFYENERIANSNEATPANRRENLNVLSTDQVDTSHAENCTNENNENENISKTEIKPLVVVRNSNDELHQRPVEENREDEFRIKLKYLNDELRLVKGTPNEAIGDFKKRNFNVELATEKLVRLVFNGHVLQPDSKTLKACGLFDNCVVHCLVHNKKASAHNERDSSNGGQDDTNDGQPSLGTNTFSERNNDGWAFIYLGMGFIVLAMTFCWYCRFQYGHLFSWYSTTGLVLMTVIFLIIFPIIVLIERGVTA